MRAWAMDTAAIAGDIDVLMGILLNYHADSAHMCLHYIEVICTLV